MGTSSTSSFTFLHVSDFHFKANDNVSFDKDIVLSPLLKKIKQVCSEDRWLPELILCSGDIAFSGKNKEYELAKVFFNELAKTAGLSPQSMYFVPGNHDIDRDKLEAHDIAMSAINEESLSSLNDKLIECNQTELVDISNKIFNTELAWQSLLEKIGAFRTFSNNFAVESIQEAFCFADIYNAQSNLTIGLVGLNSCWFSEGKGNSEYGHLLIGLRAMLRAFNKLLEKAKSLNKKLDLTITMYHHPIEWFYSAERQIIRNTLAQMSDIVLEGHQDDPQQQIQMTNPDNKALILQEGPAYKDSNYPNNIQFVRFEMTENQKTIEVKPIMFDRVDRWVDNTTLFAAHERPDGHGYFILSESPVLPQKAPQISHWNEFFSACHKFETGRSYLLLIGDTSGSAADLSALARVDWELVLDFDPNTAVNGTYSKVREQLSTSRSLHPLTPDAQVTFNPTRSTYWIAARGLSDQPTTLVDDSWRSWNRRYSDNFRKLLSNFAISCGQRPVTIVILWNGDDYIRTVCETLDTVLGSSLNYVFATTYTKQISNIANVFGSSAIPINLPDICRGIKQMIEPRIADTSIVELPSFSQEAVQLPHETLLWIEEDLEIVHLGVGRFPPNNCNPGNDYYRGHNITWFELAMHYDIDRERTSGVRQAVLKALESRSTRRINLYHWPGAGGTTLARRIAWEMHEGWPSVLLHRVTGEETISRLRALYDITQL